MEDITLWASALAWLVPDVASRRVRARPAGSCWAIGGERGGWDTWDVQGLMHLGCACSHACAGCASPGHCRPAPQEVVGVLGVTPDSPAVKLGRVWEPAGL